MLSSFFFSHVSWCKREGGGERKRKQREDTWRTWSSVSSASVRGLLATFLRTISFPGRGGGGGEVLEVYTSVSKTSPSSIVGILNCIAAMVVNM